MHADDIDVILAPDYLDHLAECPLDEVRAKRAHCVRAGDTLSYVRRLIHGRIDILEAERMRRVEGGDPGDLSELVGRLAEALGEGGRPHGPGRLPQRVAPPDHDPSFTAELDEIVDAVAGQLPDMSEPELEHVLGDLRELERSVSGRRRAVHDRVDALQAELTRRYRTGEATVDSLLG
ncbi:MAG: aerial mycelium formation protein [Acidimicrobiales bacterium]|nr:aerial mycelium formation protein [Acidimicrobiales bacterium]